MSARRGESEQQRLARIGAELSAIARKPTIARESIAIDAVVAAPISGRIPQAVAMLGVSRSKLYQFIRSGEIEVVKIGRATLIPVDSLTRFIETRRLGTPHS